MKLTTCQCWIRSSERARWPWRQFQRVTPNDGLVNSQSISIPFMPLIVPSIGGSRGSAVMEEAYSARARGVFEGTCDPPA